MMRPIFRALAGLVVFSFLSLLGCTHDVEGLAKPGNDGAVSSEAGLPDVGSDKGKPDGPAADGPAADLPTTDAPVIDGPVVDAPVTDAPPVDLVVTTDHPTVDQMPPDKMLPDQMLPDLTPPDLVPTPDQSTCTKVGESCNDHNPCTKGDKCLGAGGPCAGQKYDCVDYITCTDDVCQGDGTCKNPVSAGACYIGGACKKTGDKSGTCAVCDPTFSQYSWAPAKGNNCVINFSGSGSGYKDGPIGSAQFTGPTGIAVDSAGVIYVADPQIGRIRKIEKGQVTTLAGSGGGGSVDGPAKSATFYSPWDLDVASDGAVYVVTKGKTGRGEHHFVRKIYKGQVTTIAGSGNGTLTTTTALNWKFWKPLGITMGIQGKIYVTDSWNHLITEIKVPNIKLFSGGLMSSKKDGAAGYANGSLLQARFQYPIGLDLGPGGSIFVADNKQWLRELPPSGTTKTLVSNIIDIKDVAADITRKKVYYASGGGSVTNPGHRIWVYDLNTSKASVVAGTGAKGAVAGPGKTTAQFNDPNGLAVDKNGFIFVADRGSAMIRVVNPN